MRRLLAHSACLFLLLATRALAWDDTGHMLVGQIAWENVRPATRERVSELVGKLPSTYNRGQPYHFVTAGCWMDDMRAMPNYPWAKYHYVTIPWTPERREITFPPPPNVVWAIEEMRHLLRDSRRLEETRVEALGMLIHLVGDIHQPMHATDRNDRGGNGFLISGLPVSSTKKRGISNLHFFWDAAYRFTVRDGTVVELWQPLEASSRPTAPGEGIIAQEAKALVAAHPRESFEELWTGGKVADAWARESHLLGCTAGYPPHAEPSDTEIHALPPAFIERGGDIARRRVAQAGYRLALALDELFSE